MTNKHHKHISHFPHPKMSVVKTELLQCNGYSSIAVSKHHDQGNLQKERFIWASEG